MAVVAGEGSVVERFRFRGHEFFVKRDDRVDPLLSGNKYRKLHRLLTMPAGRVRMLLSYGGAQSNAMLALAALCRRKGWSFHYTTRQLPARLRTEPAGNLRMALALGMQLHEVAHADYASAVSRLSAQCGDDVLLVPQGGADAMARDGVAMLAGEILRWRQRQHVQRLHVVTPAGTGTTAFYLAEALPEVQVLTTPVVGDAAYLRAQMARLGPAPDNLRILAGRETFHFARPHPALLAIYQELLAAGIEFDLVYGCPMWHVLMQHLDAIDGALLYVHSGGLTGNATMLDRYRYRAAC